MFISCIKTLIFTWKLTRYANKINAIDLRDKIFFGIDFFLLKWSERKHSTIANYSTPIKSEVFMVLKHFEQFFKTFIVLLP